MDIDDLVQKGKQISRKVRESAQGNLSQVGERSVRKAVEQAIGIAKIAVQELKQSGLPKTGRTWVGAKVSITFVELSIQVEVRPDGSDQAEVFMRNTAAPSVAPSVPGRPSPDPGVGAREERTLLF